MRSQNSVDVTISICGSAGDGSIAAGEIFNRAVALMGYHIMNFDSYPAEIRGFGKSVAHTRISDQRVLTPGQDDDCLISLNDPHSITELPKLAEDGVIIYDSKPPGYVEEDLAIAGFVEPGMVGYGIPLRELSTMAVKSTRSRNIVALGAAASIFRLPAEPFHEAIALRWASKAEKIIKSNVEAFDLGYKYASEHLQKSDSIDFGMRTLERKNDVKIISGNEAVANACIEAGLRLYAGYPITPATKIMEILGKKLPVHGGAVVQTEDEISAIGHVIGGGFAGKRSMTATSGPGLCLMVESLNLAVMAEIPLVVVDTQRGGPSTGLPTKTEQSDLNLAVFGASGDSPKPVVAPANVEECFELAVLAFELAEAYQTPVVLLLDFFLSNRIEDVIVRKIRPDKWGKHIDVVAEDTEGLYRRFKITDSGVSPRSYPGKDDLFFAATGLEHDERGMPNYNGVNHTAMSVKRYAKLDTLLANWREETDYGDEGELDIGIISWGSSIGAAMEAINRLKARGIKAGGYFPRLMWPVQQEKLVRFSERAKKLMVAELNYTGQFANIVQRFVSRDIMRFNQVRAEPLAVGHIVEAAAGGLK